MSKLCLQISEGRLLNTDFALAHSIHPLQNAIKVFTIFVYGRAVRLDFLQQPPGQLPEHLPVLKIFMLSRHLLRPKLEDLSGDGVASRVDFICTFGLISLTVSSGTGRSIVYTPPEGHIAATVILGLLPSEIQSNAWARKSLVCSLISLEHVGDLLSKAASMGVN